MKHGLIGFLFFFVFMLTGFSQSQSRLGIGVGYRFFDYPNAFENNGFNFILTPLYSLSGKRLELQTGVGLSLINIPNLNYHKSVINPNFIEGTKEKFLEYLCYTIHLSPNIIILNNKIGIFSFGFNAEISSSINSYKGVGSWHVGNLTPVGITTLDYGINLSFLKEMVNNKRKMQITLIFLRYIEKTGNGWSNLDYSFQGYKGYEFPSYYWQINLMFKYLFNIRK